MWYFDRDNLHCLPQNHSGLIYQDQAFFVEVCLHQIVLVMILLFCLLLVLPSRPKKEVTTPLGIGVRLGDVMSALKS